MPDIKLNSTKQILTSLFKAYKWRIIATYLLFNLENLLRLIQPFTLGLAINSLLSNSYFGISALVVQHLSYLLIGSLRQVYDTRTFTKIYTHLATQIVVDQRKSDVSVSKVVARSALSREFVDFFEHNFPLVIQSLYSLIGALVMLFFYDWVLIIFCLLLIIPASILNYFYSQKSYLLNGKLNDQIENEVNVIEKGDFNSVETHYKSVASWRIKLSDIGAINFSLMELFILSLVVFSLIRYCNLSNIAAGDIYATFNYVITFITGLDIVPFLVQQVSRLIDISQRVQQPDNALDNEENNDPLKII